MTEMRLLWLLVLVVTACAGHDEDRRRFEGAEMARPSVDSASAPKAAAAMDLLLSEAGLGPARMCASLDQAAAALGPVRDSAFVGESDDVRWPGKLVRLPDGHDVVLEASWVDSARLWRISTTSPRALTRSGVRVGTALADIPSASGPLEVKIPEGRLVLELQGDSVGALIDSASEREFHRRWTPEGDWLSAVPPSAYIIELFNSGGCQHLDSAA